MNPAARLALLFMSILVVAACSGAQAPTPVAETTNPSQTEPPPVEATATPEAVDSLAPQDAEPAPEVEDLEPDLEMEHPSEPEPEPEPEPVDHAGTLEISLEAYEQAVALWQRGEMEQAYEALDDAYTLMATVPANGDPLLAQEKENLRQLISERVLQIHASQLSAAGDLNDEIPIVINEYVERELKSFQGPERENFLASYQRSGLYRPMIVEALREAGMPEALSWLPMVESWFKVRAYSRARALGMWQFIPSTGYRYGMSRDWWIDERMDPEKSTKAAIAYLTDLHRLFGDWMTALAGYNCGEGAVKRAINRQSEDYLDQFWDIYTRLPRETRRYVPRFMATLLIINDPAKYGFDLPEPFAPQDYEIVEIRRSAELASIDGLLNLPAKTLEGLNPELRRKATPGDAYPLKVPSGQAPTLISSLETLPEWAAPSSITTGYRVRRGDTLSGIASRHGTSVAALMDLNNLRSANRLSIGQRLQVPDTRPSGGVVSSSSGGQVVYTVRNGDSLWSLAKRFGTTVDRIRGQNNLPSNTLQPGQRLTIGSASPSATNGGTTYTVRTGDTLGKIAGRHSVSLSRLLSANGLNTRSTIHPGQKLVIPR